MLVVMSLARRQLLMSAGFAFAALPWSVQADPPPGKGRGRKQREAEGENGGGNTAGRVIGAAVFSALEVQRIRGYYASQPGMRAKRLPPGIAKNLARGKPLPPGIAKRYAPRDLVRELSGRNGYEILVAGASILLVEAATGVIRDIVENAISG
jgi:hypothetical protein